MNYDWASNNVGTMQNFTYECHQGQWYDPNQFTQHQWNQQYQQQNQQGQICSQDPNQLQLPSTCEAQNYQTWQQQQMTYDVPPNQTEGQLQPAFIHEQDQHQDWPTYDVPPNQTESQLQPAFIHEQDQHQDWQTYDVPPNQTESQLQPAFIHEQDQHQDWQTYDVPPNQTEGQLQPAFIREQDQHQDWPTYDVPPNQTESQLQPAFIREQDQHHDWPTYDVPPNQTESQLQPAFIHEQDQHQDWQTYDVPPNQTESQLQPAFIHEQDQHQDWPTYDVPPNQTEGQLQPAFIHEQDQHATTGIIEDHQLDYVNHRVLLCNQQVSQNIATSDSYQPNFHTDVKTASLASSANGGVSQDNQEFDMYNKSLNFAQVGEQIDRLNSTNVSRDGSEYHIHHQYSMSQQGTDAVHSDGRNENVENSTLSSGVVHVAPQVDNRADCNSVSGVTVVGGSQIHAYANHNHDLLSPVMKTEDDGNYQSVSEQLYSSTCTPNHLLLTTTVSREKILDSGINIHQLSAQLQSVSLQDRVDVDANNIKLGADNIKHIKPIGISDNESSSHMPLSERHISQLPESNQAQSVHFNPGNRISDDWELIPPQILLPQEHHNDQVPTQSNVHFIIGSSNESSPIPGGRMDQSFSSTSGNISPSSQNTQGGQQGPMSVTHTMSNDRTDCSAGVNFPDMSLLKTIVDLSREKKGFPSRQVHGSLNEGENPFQKTSPKISKKQTTNVNSNYLPFLTLFPRDQMKNSLNVSGETSEFGSKCTVENVQSVNVCGTTSVHKKVNSGSTPARSIRKELPVAKIGLESQNPISLRKESLFQPPNVRHSRSADNPKFSYSKSNPNCVASKRMQYDEAKKSVKNKNYDTPCRKKYSSSLEHDSRPRVHERTNKQVLADKLGSSADKVFSKPPSSTSKLSHMCLQPSLPEIQTKQNVSPLTMSWANPELPVPASSPALSVLTSRLDHQIKESSPEPQIKGIIIKDNSRIAEAQITKNDPRQQNIKDSSEYDYRSQTASQMKVSRGRRDGPSHERSLEREHMDEYCPVGERCRDDKLYYNRYTSHSGYWQEGNRFPKEPYRDNYLDRNNEADGRYGCPSSRQNKEYDYDYYGHPYYYDNGYGENNYYPESRYSQDYCDELGYYHRPRYNNGRPPQSVSQYAAGYDAYDVHSHSGAHTPGSISDGGENDQPYGCKNQYKRYGSHPSSGHGYEDPQYYSKADYDYYNRGYNPDPRNWKEIESWGGRMTPAKFSYPHVCARFGPSGQLIKIQPNRPTEGQPAIVEIHDLEDMLGDLEDVEELKKFPGPLAREDTYKNDVLLFCQKKTKVCSKKTNLTDRESSKLIWRLLELLIKQNGTVVGTDIADLLLEGHESATREYMLSGMKSSQSLDNLDVDEELVSEAGSTMEGCVRTMVLQGRSKEETTDRFRHLLLHGRKKDALDWAMKNNLWGHALFLAGKMDNRTHANIMMKFTNNAMRLNDPLQTLYQLMSGRQPAAVTCIADIKWGDWRPHLAMLLSNHSSRPELDKKSIVLMGDTLATKGYLHASHFCYLMAQVSFGSYSNKSSKMVLIGSNHTLPIEEFATNEAIQCTEIYEYAMSLGKAGYMIGSFQYFKFLYACRMAEYGHLQEALHYCEIISSYIQRTPGFYQPILVRQVYELGNRLKYFDAQRMQNSEDADNPIWLQQLQRIMQGLEDGSIVPLSGTVTPMEYGIGNSSECGEVDGLMSGTDTSQSYCQNGTISLSRSRLAEDQSQYEQTQQYQPNQTQNQFDQSQYANSMSQQSQSQTNSSQYWYDHSQFQAKPIDQSLHDQPQYAHDSSQNVMDIAAGQSGNNAMTYGIPGHQSGHQQQAYNYDEDMNAYNYGQPKYIEQSTGTVDSVQPGIIQLPETSTQTDVGSGSTPEEVPGGHDPPSVQRQVSRASTSSHQSRDSKGLSNSFNYFEDATHQQWIIPPRLRKRTTSESSTGSVTSHGGISSQPQPSCMTSKSVAEKKDTNGKTKKQTKSWFEIFSWSKSKNEMELPDDKNPALIWDPVKKPWENTDGDEETETMKLPPPKVHELSRCSTLEMEESYKQTPTDQSNSLNPEQPTTISDLQSAESATTEAPEEAAAQSSMPKMFNPAQFQSNQTHSQTSAGPKRYGQRRVYPK